MTSTAQSAGRRTVRYETMQEFLDDVDSVTSGEYSTVGHWNAAQILEHLARSLHWSIDGYPFKAPLYMRMAGPFIKNSILINPMKPGIKLPRSAAELEPESGVSFEDALEHLREGIRRLSVETPTATHPIFGAMASEEWVQLHLRHAELHMSFLVPTA